MIYKMASSDSELTALADYKSSLDDLDCNSKPLINVLTMLAEENQHFANGIVDIIKERILEVLSYFVTFLHRVASIFLLLNFTIRLCSISGVWHLFTNHNRSVYSTFSSFLAVVLFI